MYSDEDSPYYCIDCKHSFIPLSERINSWLLFRKCNQYDYKCGLTYSAEADVYDPVVGVAKQKAEYVSCHKARLMDSHCGKFGKNWAPKHKKDLFKYIKKDNNE